MNPQLDVTALLLRWNAGDRAALEELTPVVYHELHRLARALLNRERSQRTVSATSLVHEAYLKLVDQRQVNWDNRAHFFGAAAHIMRRVLIDHAKAKLAGKRGGSVTKIRIDDEDIPSPAGIVEDVLALDDALTSLGRVDARKAQVVEMKFFAGMTNAEAARALGVADATVERDWKMARAWLIRTLMAGAPKAQD